MSFAAFILSTGRCGTQWIAKSLGEVYADLLEVEHEPLHDEYEARKALAGSVLEGLPLSYPPAVAAHLDRIEGQLETRSYLECGHPCWSTIPYFADRFRGRVRIIHLTRHPVPSCYSWLTHGAFQTPWLPHMQPKILLSPFDEGIQFPEYQASWDRLNPFERCLYYWSEVHAFADDLRSRLDVPWLHLRYEDLFAGDGLARLLEFLDLPSRPAISGHRGEVEDQHRFISPVWDDWRVIEQHPGAMAVARKLGYGLDEVDEAALRRRYLPPTPGE